MKECTEQKCEQMNSPKYCRITKKSRSESDTFHKQHTNNPNHDTSDKIIRQGREGLTKRNTLEKKYLTFLIHLLYRVQDRESLFTVPEGGFDVSEVQLHLQKEHGDQINLPPHLQTHIEFLESQNIVGVSHHDLLFSKDAPEREEEEGEEGEDPRNYAQPIK